MLIVRSTARRNPVVQLQPEVQCRKPFDVLVVEVVPEMILDTGGKPLYCQMPSADLPPWLLESWNMLRRHQSNNLSIAARRALSPFKLRPPFKPLALPREASMLFALTKSNATSAGAGKALPLLTWSIS